jgi:CheY-like chemotaxis protein
MALMVYDPKNKEMEEQRTERGNLEKMQQINTVLVVDDDADWCFLAKIILKKAGVGKQIITAQNGLEGIKTLQAIVISGQRLPELIFLDIKMPVMDGFEFLDEITKSTELFPAYTRIFLCSSSIHFKDKERADSYPVAGFITKPLTPEILKSILAN